MLTGLLIKKVFQGATVKDRYDFDFPKGTVDRYVRVQLLGQNALSLVEVEVYGTLLGGKQVSHVPSEKVYHLVYSLKRSLS